MDEVTKDAIIRGLLEPGTTAEWDGLNKVERARLRSIFLERFRDVIAAIEEELGAGVSAPSDQHNPWTRARRKRGCAVKGE